jgi:hypothetical protein
LSSLVAVVVVLKGIKEVAAVVLVVIEQMSPHQSVLEITLPLFNSQSLLDPQHIQLPLVVVDQVVLVLKVVVGEIHLLDQ